MAQSRRRKERTRPQPTRTREELPTRTTRRSSILSLDNHRIPIDCPSPNCDAKTVHQHYNNLQFFNPHPANEIRYRGYVSSHRVTSSQPNVADGEPAMQGEETCGPEISDVAAKEQDENEQRSVTGGDRTDDQKEPMKSRTPVVSLKVAVPEEGNDDQRSVTLADLPKKQQGIAILDEATPEEDTIMDDGISDLTPGDPITSRQTLEFVEDLVNSAQTIPMAIDYQMMGTAWDSREVREQPKESQLTVSRGLQDMFDEWLIPMTPEEASETLSWDTETLGDPLQIPIQGEKNGEVPSGMKHPASDPYMPQFQVTGEDEDLKTIFGHSEKD